jgi:hypothetical protein
MDTTNRNRMDRVRFTLLALAVLFGAWAAARVAGYLTGPARAEDTVARAIARNAPDANEVKPYLEKAKETAEALKKKNLFSKEPPKENPVKQIDGILGSEVLIGDNWYKVGAKIGDAKILTIEPTRVTIEWDGKKKVFSPLGGDEDKSSGPSKPPQPAPKKPSEPQAAKPDDKAEKVTVAAPVSTAEEDPLAWMGVNLPPALRAKLMEKWNSASDEEKAEAKEQWNKMSQDQKDEAIRSMENM